MLSTKYKINEIFFSLQGEGFNQGKEVIFIRLSGCNLACPWCDTKHQDYTEYTVAEILGKIKDWDCKSVIITGGEPTFHCLKALLSQLKENSYWIGIESNGTCDMKKIKEYIDYIAISPKDEIRIKEVNEIRIVNDGISLEYLKEIENDIKAKHYYLSPLEKDEEMNIKETMVLLGKINESGNEEWGLSLQLHKLAGIQ